MTQRLPLPGGDNGTWGTILNGFLGVAHNADGTLQTSALSTAGSEVLTNKNQASGYAGLDNTGAIPVALLPANIPITKLAATGTASSSTFLRGDGTWATTSGTYASLSGTNTWSGSNTFDNTSIFHGELAADGQIILYGASNKRLPIGTDQTMNGSLLATDTSDVNDKVLFQLSGGFEGGFTNENTTDAVDHSFIWGTDMFFATGTTVGDIAGITDFYAAEIEAHLKTPSASLNIMKGIQVDSDIDSQAINSSVGTRYGILVTSGGSLPSGATVSTSYGIRVDPATFGTYTVTDAVTNGTTTVTSATGNFGYEMRGAAVTGTNIPASTTVIDTPTANTITLSQAATGSGTGGTLNVASTYAIYASGAAPSYFGGGIVIPNANLNAGTGEIIAQSMIAGPVGAAGRGRLTAVSSSTGAVVSAFQGISGQTADLSQWVTYAGVVKSRISSLGGFVTQVTSAYTTSTLNAGELGLVTNSAGGLVLYSNVGGTLYTQTAATALNPTAVLTASYSAVVNDLSKWNLTSGSISQSLPSAPPDKSLYAAKIVVQPGSNTLTLNCQGSDVINVGGGSTSYTLKLLDQSVILQYQATGAIWNVISDDLPLSQLDTRYSSNAGVENVNTVAASGSGTVTIPDVTTATMNDITLTGNCTFAFPTIAAGKSFSMTLIQDATGSRTVTWPTVKWPGGAAPTLTATPNKQDVFTFCSFDGSNWLGFTAGQNL